MIPVTPMLEKTEEDDQDVILLTTPMLEKTEEDDQDIILQA